jgi:hypothetical protein
VNHPGRLLFIKNGWSRRQIRKAAAGECDRGAAKRQAAAVDVLGGKGLADVLMISSRFLVSLHDLCERRGDEILNRVADEHPELILLSQIKLVSVTRIEVSSSHDYSKLKS